MVPSDPLDRSVAAGVRTGAVQQLRPLGHQPDGVHPDVHQEDACRGGQLHRRRQADAHGLEHPARCSPRRCSRSMTEQPSGELRPTGTWTRWKGAMTILFWQTSTSTSLDGVDLTEAVRHQSTRPVSLVELLDAFEEAKRDAEIQAHRQKVREAAEAHQREVRRQGPQRGPEKDVAETWDRILKCGNGPICIEDLFNGEQGGPDHGLRLPALPGKIRQDRPMAG